MSQENVDIVRRAFEAFNRDDIDAVVADFAPDCEYIPSGAIPGVTDLSRGPEGYKRFVRLAFRDEFDDAHLEIHELIDAGDHVFVSLNIRGRGKQSGAETSWHLWNVWRLRDGKVVHGQGFTARRGSPRSRRAAGVGPGSSLVHLRLLGLGVDGDVHGQGQLVAQLVAAVRVLDRRKVAGLDQLVGGCPLFHALRFDREAEPLSGHLPTVNWPPTMSTHDSLRTRLARAIGLELRRAFPLLASRAQVVAQSNGTGESLPSVSAADQHLDPLGSRRVLCRRST